MWWYSCSRFELTCAVMAHVAIRVGTDLIESVITRRSAEEMKLKIGDTVKAVIKSTEVMLEKD
jgi:molybdopterin-binding protein